MKLQLRSKRTRNVSATGPEEEEEEEGSYKHEEPDKFQLESKRFMEIKDMN